MINHKGGRGKYRKKEKYADVKRYIEIGPMFHVHNILGSISYVQRNARYEISTIKPVVCPQTTRATTPDDNDTRLTIHDHISSLEFMPNESISSTYLFWYIVAPGFGVNPVY